jgi:raffinose/stachyose/melibiose transport system substrate-binding protein
MRKRKNYAAVLATVAVVVLASGCSAAGSSSDGGSGDGSVTEISGFIGSPEILSQTEAAIKVFNKENKKIHMTYVQGQANEAPLQQLMAMYASGSVPTVFILDPPYLDQVANKVADLSNEKWVQEVFPWTRQQATRDGKVLGAPQSVASVGLVYNRKLVEDAIGGTFDPSTVKTRSDLAALFEKVKASGKAPSLVSPLGWSLASHYLQKLYDARGDDAARSEFIAQLKAGKADLGNDRVFNGLMDTLDLLRKYNVNASKPLDGTIETDAKTFAEGKAAFWYMGDFVWTTLQGFGASPAGNGYGIMPVPVSDDPSDIWNQKIMSTTSQLMLIDKTKNSPAQQQAAKDFINWYAHSTSGQDFMVNKAGLVPGFTNVKLTATNPLTRQVTTDLANNRTYSPILTIPPTHVTDIGNLMIKYVGGKTDRAGVTKALTDYWKSQK